VLVTRPVSLPVTTGTKRTVKVGTVFTVIGCGDPLDGHTLSARLLSATACVGSRSTSTRIVVRTFAAGTSRFHVEVMVPSAMLVRTEVSGAVMVLVVSSVAPSYTRTRTSGRAVFDALAVTNTRSSASRLATSATELSSFWMACVR